MPSDDAGAKASDFESWFYIREQGRPHFSTIARLCTMLLSNRPHKQAEKESNWGLKPHQDQWVMWEKRNCATDAASRLTRHHERSLPVCDTICFHSETAESR